MAARRPKRSRYTVTVHRAIQPTPQDKAILAYDLYGARRYFEARGWTVTNVRKGDYVNFLRPNSGWSLDPAGYKQAIQTLGIVWRVKIGTTRHQGGQRGIHRLKNDSYGLYHEITMKSWLTPEEASATLWHELTHAMQAERAAEREVANPSGLSVRDAARMVADCRVAWRADPGKRGTYSRRPIEHEAKRISAKYATALPVTR